jgi:hypothetical protein
VTCHHTPNYDHQTHLLISNDLLIELIDVDLLLAVRSLKQIDKVVQELSAEFLDMFLGIFADEQHLSYMAFALYMTLESVFIAHLALASLAVPSQSA